MSVWEEGTLSSTHPEAESAPRFAELAAAGQNAWWRYGLSIVIISAVFIASNIIVYIVAVSAVMLSTAVPGAGIDREIRGRIDGILANGIDDWTAVGNAEPLAAFAIIMVPFALTLAGTLLSVALIHKRPWRTLISARAAFHWRGFLLSLAVMAGLLASGLVLGALMAPDEIDFVFDARRFLLFLPFVLALLPLQVLAEEVLFRGYLLQLVARLSRSGVLRILVPTALFVLVHLPNKEVAFGGVWAMLFFGVLGAYLTLLAIRGNGLEYAFGFHVGLNAFVLLVISSAAASMPTPTIFIDRAPDFPSGLVVIVLFCALHYWVVFRLPRPRRS